MAGPERPQDRNYESEAPSHNEREGSALPEMTEREAYFHSLRLWIQQAQVYQNLSTCFPYYMMTFQGIQNNPSNTPLLNNNYQVPGPQWPFPFPHNARIIPDVNRPTEEPLSNAEVIARYGGYEYVIPPLYKRLLAEFIDFMLLFVLKLIVTFVAVDMLEFIDLEKFDLNKLSQNLNDYQLAIEITSEILLLEVIYRVLVCFFEAWCLGASGATPGKALLGLRVVSAAAVVAVPGRERTSVLLYPGGALSLPTAFGRSLLKNTLISLLFPLCFVLFMFRFNRTGYDVICNVIVVEENMYPPRRNAP